MAVTETLLIGIACILSQATPEAEKIKSSLTKEQQRLVEYMKENRVCEELDAYLKENENSIDGKVILAGCGSCLQTSKVHQ